MSSQALQLLIAAILTDLKTAGEYGTPQKVLANYVGKHKRTPSNAASKLSMMLTQSLTSISISQSPLSSPDKFANFVFEPSRDATEAVDAFIRAHPLTVSGTLSNSVVQHSGTQKLMQELIRILNEKVIHFDNEGSGKILAFDPKVLVFSTYLHMLLPCFEPSKFIDADWWNSLLRPILLKSSWKTLLDVCRKILKELLSGEHFSSLLNPGHFSLKTDQITSPATDSAKKSNTSIGAVLELRHTVLSSYLSERIDTWGTRGVTNTTKNSNSSKPYWETLGEANLEVVLLDFALAHPKDFFVLLAEFCESPAHRLQSLLLICRFMRKEELQSYFIIETPLFDVLLKCVMVDTHPAIVCTAITVVVLLMPHCCTRLGNKDILERLLTAFLRSIIWSIDYEKISTKLKAISSETMKESFNFDKSTVDDLLISYSKSASADSVEYFFAFLYGMFPCTTIRFLRGFVNSKIADIYQNAKSEEPPSPTSQFSDFPIAHDPFEPLRSRILQNASSHREAAEERILQLLQNHKVHHNLILFDPDRERTCQHFSGKEPFEIAMECLHQRINFGTSDISILFGESTPNAVNSPTEILDHSYQAPFMSSSASQSQASHAQSSPDTYRSNNYRFEHTLPVPSYPQMQKSASQPIYTKPSHFAGSETDADTVSQENAVSYPNHAASPDIFSTHNPLAGSLDYILEMNRFLRKAVIEMENKGRHHKFRFPGTMSLHKKVERKSSINSSDRKSVDSATHHTKDHTSQDVSSTIEVLKLHLFMLMNELNFETAMRNTYLQQIRKLRKELLLNDQNAAENISEDIKIQQLQVEIAHYKRLQQSLNKEVISLREIQQKQELNLYTEHTTTEVLQDEIGKLRLKVEEEQRASNVLRTSVEERDATIAKLKLQLDGIMTDFAYLKECETALNNLTKEALDREGEKIELEEKGLKNEETHGKLIAAKLRIKAINELESELRSTIARQELILSQTKAQLIQFEDLFETQRKTIQDQDDTMRNLRLKNSEHMAALKAKYETIKKINVQLEARIVELQTKLEDELPEEPVIPLDESTMDEDNIFDPFSQSPDQS